MQCIRVRIKETGQVQDMIPAVATAMILGGTADRVDTQTESMTLAPAAETAVAPAQAGPRKRKAS